MRGALQAFSSFPRHQLSVPSRVLSSPSSCQLCAQHVLHVRSESTTCRPISTRDSKIRLSLTSCMTEINCSANPLIQSADLFNLNMKKKFNWNLEISENASRAVSQVCASRDDRRQRSIIDTFKMATNSILKCASKQRIRF